MGSLTRDMERLANEIGRGRDTRRHQMEALRHHESERRRSAAEAARRRAQEILELKRGVQETLHNNRSRLQAETTELRGRLQAFASDLRTEVDTFRAEVQEDLAGARAAWHGTASLSAPVPPRVSPASQAPTPSLGEEPAQVDDLTTIPGIGPGMQERLNKAGISSFLQLATRPIHEIRDVLGELNRLANVEEWVREATNRAGGSSQ